jgi:serine/threonine protein kinase
MRGAYSIKSDVFSFGVLILEIVTGRRNSISYDSEQSVDLLSLVSILTATTSAVTESCT